jgi:hypothetical protein
MFPQYADLNQHYWNRAVLTARQHFIAHLLLWKAYANPPMTHAANMMANRVGEKTNNRLYAKLKEAQASTMRDRLSGFVTVFDLETREKVRISSEEYKTEKATRYVHSSCLEKTKQKQTETMLSRYGVSNPMQSQVFIEKIKESTLMKFGYENISQVPETKERIARNNLKNYGHVCNLHGNAEKEKIKKIMNEKYGVDFSMQNKNIQEKSRQTCKKNYGVDYPQQSAEIREKTKQTCLAKYGTELPAQNGEVKEKTERTNMKKYGHKSHLQSEEHKRRMLKRRNRPLVLEITEYAKERRIKLHSSFQIKADEDLQKFYDKLKENVNKIDNLFQK